MDELKNSIVHEYSILYSSRIIQKDKKWNDGKLKHYEFNNKLEIFNEDGNLIEVDFISEKFKQNLVEQNEFKLPNNRLLIEIDCKLSSYTRDVSELFKRPTKDAEPSSMKTNAIGITKIKSEPNQIKQERVIKPKIYQPLKHEPFKKTLGKKIMVKQEQVPIIKQETLSLPVTLPQSASCPIIKQEPIDNHIEGLITGLEVQKQNLRKNEERRSLPRVHPKSSRIFKYLTTNQALSPSSNRSTY